MKDIGIDVDDPQVKYGRTWRWGKATILGLLSRPMTRDLAGNRQCTRLQAQCLPDRPPQAAAQ